ncbi:LPXTG cell wall anchor domain-containing protein (plasmid) [Clostridium perfringens]
MIGKRKRKFGFLLATTMLFNLFSGATAFASEKENTSSTKTFSVSKSVGVAEGCRNLKVNLKIKPTNLERRKNVVVLFDRSGSMVEPDKSNPEKTVYDTIEPYTLDFLKIVNNPNTYLKFISFAGPNAEKSDFITTPGSMNDVTVNSEFTNNYSTLSNMFKNLQSKISVRDTTDMECGLIKAKEVLSELPADQDNYFVFITDGYPNVAKGLCWTTNSPGFPNVYSSRAIDVANQIKKLPNLSNFFSIGIFENMKISDKGGMKVATQTLDEISKGYPMFNVTNDGIGKAYNEIMSDIYEPISTMKVVEKLNPIVTENFDIKNVKASQGEAKIQNGSIVWEGSKVNKEIDISYEIQAKNDNVLQNGYNDLITGTTTITANDNKGNEYSTHVDTPKTNIPKPLEVSINNIKTSYDGKELVNRVVPGTKIKLSANISGDNPGYTYHWEDNNGWSSDEESPTYTMKDKPVTIYFNGCSETNCTKRVSITINPIIPGMDKIVKTQDSNTAKPGDEHKYHFSNIANTGNVDLKNFNYIDVLPTEAVRLKAINTGIWEQENTQDIYYKTNKADWKLWEKGVSTKENKTLYVSDLKLADGEYITSYKVNFESVAPGFREGNIKPGAIVTVNKDVTDGQQFTNEVTLNAIANGENLPPQTSTVITKVDKPIIKVSVNKNGESIAKPGEVIKYDFDNVKNLSNRALDTFTFTEELPNAIRLQEVNTGTFNQDTTYGAYYKTNKADWKLWKDGLKTTVNNQLQVADLKLADGEYITSFKFEFKNVNKDFSNVSKPSILTKVNEDLQDGYEFVNVVGVTGTFENTKVTDEDTVTTIVNKPIIKVSVKKYGVKTAKEGQVIKYDFDNVKNLSNRVLDTFTFEDQLPKEVALQEVNTGTFNQDTTYEAYYKTNKADWKLWKDGLSTTVNNKLQVANLKLADGEYITSFKFEFKNVNKDFGETTKPFILTKVNTGLTDGQQFTNYVNVVGTFDGIRATAEDKVNTIVDKPIINVSVNKNGVDTAKEGQVIKYDFDNVKNLSNRALDTFTFTDNLPKEVTLQEVNTGTFNQDTTYGAYYKTNKSGWKLWKDGLKTTANNQLQVADLKLADGEYITSFKFEFKNVNKDFKETVKPFILTKVNTGLTDGQQFTNEVNVVGTFDGITATASDKVNTTVDKPIIKVSVKKYGVKTAKEGQVIKYDFDNVKNLSNRALDTFTFTDNLPKEVTLQEVNTGTFNQDTTYGAYYKTNKSDWKLWKDSLKTTANNQLQVADLKLADGEYITSFKFEFKNVNKDFKETVKPSILTKVNTGLTDGQQFTNEVNVVGTFDGIKATAEDKANTIVDKPLINVSVNKNGVDTAKEGQVIKYDFDNIENLSNRALDTFTFTDNLPKEVTLQEVNTGTFNQDTTYGAYYKTNKSDWKLWKDGLKTTVNNKLQVADLKLADGEYITSFKFEFKNVNKNFKETVKPFILTKVNTGLTDGEVFTNYVDVVGTFDGITATASDKVNTTVDKPIINVSVNKNGVDKAKEGQVIKYDFDNVRNLSNRALDTFTFTDNLPKEVTLQEVNTGTFNQDTTYEAYYKTNKSGWKLWKDDLKTTANNQLKVADLKLADGEYITSFKFEFKNVNKDFKETVKPSILTKVNTGLTDGQQFTNEVNVVGTFDGIKATAEDKVTTIVDKPIINVSVNKHGVDKAKPGEVIKYDFNNVKNLSNRALDTFTFEDQLPKEVALQEVNTGTFNQDTTYEAYFKTNKSDWKLWKDGLKTTANNQLKVADLKLADGEYITSFKFEFKNVNKDFGETTKPFILTKVDDSLQDGQQFTNNVNVVGTFDGIKATAEDKVTTIVDKPLIKVSVNKEGNKTAKPGEVIKYTFDKIKNLSNRILDTFTFTDNLPKEVTLQEVNTGTFNQDTTYGVYYKTNKSDWKLWKDGLKTTVNNKLQVADLKLADGEYITSFKFEFKGLNKNFSEITKPFILTKVNENVKPGKFTNEVNVVGTFDGIKATAEDKVTTIVPEPTIIEKILPHTGGLSNIYLLLAGTVLVGASIMLKKRNTTSKSKTNK